MKQTSSVEEYKQLTNFQLLSKTLRQEKFADHRARALAYWALPGDRRLPLALLGHTIQDLIDTPFETLAATPGIGRKKVASLLKLLSRATKDDGAKETFADDGAASQRGRDGSAGARAAFDPAAVSEAVWEQWRATVRRHKIGHEKLGRLIASLQSLPTVMWHTPLAAYLDSSIAEIRKLKTHGDKRVGAILEVFHAVHQVLGSSDVESHLSLRLLPKFCVPVERWIDDCLEHAERPTTAAIRECLALPLVEQTRIDCGSTIARLAEGRLGIHGPQQVVRTQSKRIGVTRARVYQLLEECQSAMNVRWPEGRRWLSLLRQKLAAEPTDAESVQILREVESLFFPDSETNRSRKSGGSRVSADGQFADERRVRTLSRPRPALRGE